MGANNGQLPPSWFKKFLAEYRGDRDGDREAIRQLSSSVNSLTEHIHRNSAEVHELRESVDEMRINQNRTNRELVRTREQSAKLFRRLIGEVKALRPSR